ncbi:MAG: PEPxxWA-CTERM sorting domain-containing protein [Novosphingobium sp.]|nr:PEP-CTERM sorting domain-containing protein [Novosphingobium sp.]
MSAVAVASLTVPTAAHAAYFIRPYVTYGGSIIDGYVANGPTSGSQQFANDVQSTVSLDDGTIKTYVGLDGPDLRGQAAGIFGDTLHFTGAPGSIIDLSFAYDGTITSGPAVNENLFTSVFTNFYVFESGSGAAYDNFSSHPGALISQSSFTTYRPGIGESLNEVIAGLLSGSFMLNAIGDYDVFVGLSVGAINNGNPGMTTTDFSNTGTFGVQTAPNVTFTSDSGAAYTDYTAPSVPEPATWAMMLLGFGLIGSIMRLGNRTNTRVRYSF